MKYRYVIINDEERSTQDLLAKFKKFQQYFCVGVSGDYNESLNMILEHMPDFVFINIDARLTEGCFNAINFVNDLYKYIDKLPEFIALSATKDHAYTCIKNNFFDYLLKPVSEFELRKAVYRLNKKPTASITKLCLKSYKDYRFLDIDEILFLKADNTSTDIFMMDNVQVSAFKTLKYFEHILPDNFVRIHNSYIVNRHYVSRIHFGKSKCTIKYHDSNIPFSKSYKENVVKLEKKLTKKALLSLN